MMLGILEHHCGSGRPLWNLSNMGGIIRWTLPSVLFVALDISGGSGLDIVGCVKVCRRMKELLDVAC